MRMRTLLLAVGFMLGGIALANAFEFTFPKRAKIKPMALVDDLGLIVTPKVVETFWGVSTCPAGELIAAGTALTIVRYKTHTGVQDQMTDPVCNLGNIKPGSAGTATKEVIPWGDCAICLL